MDRPSGPLGAATQSTGRPLENGIIRPNNLNTARRIPPQTVRHAASTSSLSAQASISSAQVVGLARDAMRNALEENQTKMKSAPEENEMKPGVTIDLSHKSIQRFPDEVVDIIKNELERLALSHNQISTFPSRFAECTSLRYLNVRNNVIREFPLSICQLTALEILDLGRNKLRVLPPELVQLTSLKVLSVQKNRIETLPVCLADMASLQVLKLDGNPVTFPPREILQPQASSPPNGSLQENEIDDVAVTAQIKRYLKQKQISDRSETESGGEESSEGTETPRPMKRVMSGRFPIKVNGTDMPDLRSPALPRPPPIPSRSHYRGLSQQNPALRRPSVVPLTIGSANERLRSNSESLLQATRDRPSDRSRRMGIVSRKASDLGTVDEIKSNRHSHYRGLSHGSAMQGNGTNGVANSRSPASPADMLSQRSAYVRRLSSLPERKRESLAPDPDVESARGILYALLQVHPFIESLLGETRDTTAKRTSLTPVVYNASTHVNELDKCIQEYIINSREDDGEAAPQSNENVRRATQTGVDVYIHVLNLLQRNVDTLIENGDPRYLRTLLLLLYGSTVEIYNAHVAFLRDPQPTVPLASLPEDEGTMRAQRRDKSITPTRERPGTSISLRTRSATIVQHPANLRVATDALPHLNGGRSATMTSATPRSGESFASSSTSGGRTGGTFTEDDRVFDKIFLKLQQSSEMSIRTLPAVNNHFFNAMKASTQLSTPDKSYWQFLIQKCSLALQKAEILKGRLSLIKLKEPGIRTEGAFWELCNAFIMTYTELALKVKEAKSISTLLHPEVIVLLRPLQRHVKETSQLINNSPWSFLAAAQVPNGMQNGAYNLQSPASQVPLPMTPQSAALGPAVQATVPSTPQSATYSTNIFHGNVFERADTFLSSNSSFAASRSGTMTSTLGAGDGMLTPSSLTSPASNPFGSRFNHNSNKISY